MDRFRSLFFRWFLVGKGGADCSTWERGPSETEARQETRASGRPGSMARRFSERQPRFLDCAYPTMICDAYRSNADEARWPVPRARPDVRRSDRSLSAIY